MGVAYNPKIVTDGLIAAVDPKNSKSYSGSGTTIFDLTNNKYNGTLYNSTSYSDGVLVFNGTSQHIGFSSPSRRFAWAPVGTTGNKIVTIETWVKTSDTTGYFFSKPWNGSGVYNYWVTPTSFVTQVATYHNLTFTSFVDGNWKHVVAVINETQKALYVNGKLYAGFTNHNEVSDTPTSGDGTIPLAVMTLYPYGAGWAGNANFSIDGSLALFRFYNRQLSEAEIQQNFNATRGRFGV